MSLYTIYNNDLKVKMKHNQLNTRSIGQVFGLFPDSIYLLTEDGTPEFADECGFFVDLRTYNMYEVHVNSIQSDQSCSSAAKTMTTPCPHSSRSPATSIKTRPKGISIKAKWPAKPPGVTAANKEDWTINIKVHHHSNGNLIKFSNFPIILNGTTANTKQISQILSVEAFGGEKVILLDNDNLQIPDTTASRG